MPRSLTLGLRPNLTQFILLAVNNAFVGAMVGIERTVVPLLGRQTFHLSSLSVLLAFIVSFGIVKGPLNLVAGRLGDRFGRKPVLVAGWLLGLPVPVMILFAPTWSWIVAANLLLGANQGFAWSMTVTSKIDIVGPKRRGLALGVNEFSGYTGVALISALSGYWAAVYGPRPVPFAAAEVVAVIGLVMALFLIRETLPFTKLEDVPGAGAPSGTRPSLGRILALVSFQNRSLFACSQAGLINKLSDTAIWGLVPVAMAKSHLSVAQVGAVSGVYAATWGVLQLGSGMWSDRVGRKLPIVLGQTISAVGLALMAAAHSFGMWMLVALLTGLGTALLYPVLLSAVGDAAPAAWRSSALGVYRMWRDGGYAIGGLLLGLGADRLGIQGAAVPLAALVFLSALAAVFLMNDTHTAKLR